MQKGNLRRIMESNHHLGSPSGPTFEIGYAPCNLFSKLAEAVGFEPTDRFKSLQFSRLVQSSTLPRFQNLVRPVGFEPTHP